MLFEAGDSVLFIGDSITDCGRRDEFFPLGNGYVSMVASLCSARYPELGIKFINRGIAGDTVQDLKTRWQSDVLDEKPSWLSVKIGVNDVWKTHTRQGHPSAVPPDVYESTYRQLLQRTHSRLGCPIILIEPFLIEPDADDAMRQLVGSYAGVARKLAGEFATVHVQTQKVFDWLMASSVRTNPMMFNVPGPEWGLDRVHPSTAGHAAIALAVLEAIGW